MPKNVRDLGKLIVAKGFKKMPKVQKSPNLVTLPNRYLMFKDKKLCHTSYLRGGGKCHWDITLKVRFLHLNI